ncbi:response regulator [Trichlorobacter ammonificans]|uniref:histidine kinase n=1 Tax=Trichlorobacter ammonificans TaxID=2916410 RepID=A0ABM9D8U9_9BACT|nr:response regulator [Trichlorobacter ammonificans]CAH2031644.1 Two-component hybrid sensor and regulator [Trichlorobacter ammonificans]
MTSYRDLTIKYKLTLGYAAVLALCCLIGFFGFRGMSEIKARLDDLQQNLMPNITTIADIDRYAQQHRRAFLHYQINAHPDHRAAVAARLSKTELQTRQTLKRLETLDQTAEERTLLGEVNLLVQQYFDAANAVQKQAASGIDHARLDAENERIFAHFSRLEAAVNRLSQLNSEEAAGHYQSSTLTYRQLCFWLALLLVCTTLLAAAMIVLISRSISTPVRTVLDAIRLQEERGRENARLAEAIAGGDLGQDVQIGEPLQLDQEQISRDEAGMLLRAVAGMSESQHALDLAFAEMTRSLRRHRDEEAVRAWLKNGQHELNSLLRGDRSSEELTGHTLTFLADYLGAGAGAFYLFDEPEGMLRLVAGYALSRPDEHPQRIALGEGLVGQAARERKLICLNAVPPDYLRIGSGLGEADPIAILILPLLHDSDLVGVIELGSFVDFTTEQLDFLQQSREAIAIALSVNRSRHLVNDLLAQTQAQAEELRVQQEELQQTNEELEERAQVLELQREHIRAKNREIEEKSRELQRKADELERVSTYKSEFLANMSHELRTPLNSLLILSGLLRDNRDGNLTRRQVEFAATINSAGRDLLTLINDILDLSKIESGHLEFHYEETTPAEICGELAAMFTPLAEEKGIDFVLRYDEPLPPVLLADSQRVRQILKNLLSNACKFTAHGQMELRVHTPHAADSPLEPPAVAFAVSDTGIGIPADKQSIIFNAFQQADGSTSRTYGGTGLGLSISRQLARSMGGEITLVSEPGNGSTFTLYLPLTGSCALVRPEPSPPLPQQPPPPAVTPGNARAVEKSMEPLPPPIADDRELLQHGERSILVIEDDLPFAAVLRDMVRERGFRALVAADGESGIALAQRHHPSAIILDVMLPHIDGWGVMRSLKDNPETRHIPVHFITCLEERRKAMAMGAIGFITKPVSSDQLEAVFGTLTTAMDKTMKMLLIVEDDPAQATAMVALLEAGNVVIKVAETGDQAIALLSSEPFDCIVLDLGLADMGAFELLEELKRLDPGRRIPVIIHTGRELSREDERRLHHYAESIIIKGAKSPERLLNEVTLFLHLIETSLDPGKQRMIRAALDKEAMLEGKKVLIVDDDMRNIFSLSSALAEKDMIILEAENGREALRQLDQHPDVNLVLMDIMMPEMDGYEAMRAIRADNRFRNLPIIALTAKAMKGDREECLNAGASDYIPKPVDMDKLFSLLRVWLYSSATSTTMDM